MKSKRRDKRETGSVISRDAQTLASLTSIPFTDHKDFWMRCKLVRCVCQCWTRSFHVFLHCIPKHKIQCNWLFVHMHSHNGLNR